MVIARKSHFLLSAALLAGGIGMSVPANAQFWYLGEIMKFTGNFCPRGSMEANGQLVSIASNSALFALYGTTYGANGQTTFALPDLRGRVPINEGSGPGLTPYSLGQVGGSETTTLTVANLPKHDHRGGIQTANANANSAMTNGNALGVSSNNGFAAPPPVPASNLMDHTTVQIAPAGGSQPISNRSPHLTMNWCIATQGIFPARN